MLLSAPPQQCSRFSGLRLPSPLLPKLCHRQRPITDLRLPFPLLPTPPPRELPSRPGGGVEEGCEPIPRWSPSTRHLAYPFAYSTGKNALPLWCLQLSVSFRTNAHPKISFLNQSLYLKPLPSWANEMRVLPLLFGQELLYFLVHWLKHSRHIASGVLRIPSIMSSRNKVAPMVVEVEETSEMSVLDLPELTLECILWKLSPAGLYNMAAVCSSLRDRCRSDHLWERHMKEKWGRLIGPVARKEWEVYVSSRKDRLASPSRGSKQRGWLESLFCVWPLSWLRSKLDDGRSPRSSVPVGSTMSWYLALESGRFWFPAQVYNRENGHVGFMLSCYDAELSYDCHTDTFHARYPPHGRRTMVIEEGVQWDRLRAPPIDAPLHDLHASDCLNDLHPGDHIEIQWRRSKEFPYGWWYGVVGHLESCDGNGHHCHCRNSDTVVLEFRQYTVGSRWREAIINRKDHHEEGNETDGFYGGIRKLCGKEEIAIWRRLWPNEILE